MIELIEAVFQVFRDGRSEELMEGNSSLARPRSRWRFSSFGPGSCENPRRPARCRTVTRCCGAPVNCGVSRACYDLYTRSRTKKWNCNISALFKRVAREELMNGLIYLVGLIVVVLFILSFLGLR